MGVRVREGSEGCARQDKPDEPADHDHQGEEKGEEKP